MPELPEVETMVRDLQKSEIVAFPITKIIVTWPKTVDNLTVEQFSTLLVGAHFTKLFRRGKYLVLVTDNGYYLCVHMRMSGSLSVHNKPYNRAKHDSVIIELETKVLAFHDTRKFGRMYLTKQPEEILSSLGMEILENPFTKEIYMLFQSRKRMIKALLLDQSFIAGIGNIYADESLFRASIHPKRLSNSLTFDEVSLLFATIKQTLSEAIEYRGTSLGEGEGNYQSSGKRGSYGANLLVYSKKGAPCRRCSTPIERTHVAQRSTYYCPHCQPITP